MRDLKTCTRAEFVEAYQNLEGLIKHLESENHHLNERLQEYEGIQTDDDKEKEFQKFWTMYQKKGNLKTSRLRFNKLTKKNKEKAMKALPEYVKATYKDARYPSRKNAEVWISKEGWNDEVFDSNESQPTFHRPSMGAKAMYKPPPRPESTVNISDRIKDMK